MVHFIYGGPGTGKTEFITQLIEQDAVDKQKALLIVPEQMTVSAEQSLVRRLPASSQLYIEVVNFSRLANKVFRLQGGLAYNFASAAYQKIMMMKAIRISAPFLTEYQRGGNDDMSLADAMLSTYKELCASGVSLESLDKLATGMNDSLLLKKIRDISTVCSVYNTLIGEKYTDTNNELSRFAELLKKNDCFFDTKLYFDGFTSFTGLEHNIIRSLIKQSPYVAFTVALPSPSSKGIDTVSLRRSSDVLRRDCAGLGVKVRTDILEENKRTSDPSLAMLAKHLWEMSFLPEEDCYSTNDSVELYRAADIYDECEMAAARARELIESGYRYRDIAVIARDADKYRGILEPALDKMHLSYFVSEKTDPSLCPISKLILSALRIAVYGWRRNDVIAHLKTGLCGITPRESDIFEAYTAKWNINGKKFTTDDPWNMNPDGYVTEKSEKGIQILEIANKVKSEFIGKLRKYIGLLKSASTGNELCIATLKYLEELNVRASLLQISAKYLSEGKAKEAGEYAKMYDVVIDALECVNDAIGDDKAELSVFSTSVRTALSESELGSIPTSPDQIMIGSANMFRSNDVKCAIIIGACDGEFPADSKANGLFTDSERDFLIEHELPLSGDRELRASDELYFFRRAVASPSEKLIVFTRADSEPSIAFSRIGKMLGDIEVKETSGEIISRLRTVESASEYINLLDGTEEGEALRRLTSSGCRAQSTELSAQNEMIPEDVISEFIGRDLCLSQSKIESFINCRFSYSCKHILQLDDGKPAQFAYNNIGTFVHHVLEKFIYRVFVINKGHYPEKPEQERIVNEIITDYISALLPDKSANSARLRHLFSRLAITSNLLIDDILDEFADSDFKPKFFELKIGSSAIPSIEFTLCNGTKMRISGIIDRVDVFRDGSKAYLRVIDYKTGSKTFSVADIKEGLNLQLLLYVFLLVYNKNPEFAASLGGDPAVGGITYLSAPQGKVRSLKHGNNDASYISAINEIKRSGLILDEKSVINAVSRSSNMRYLMASSKKKSIVSSEGFEQLYSQVSDILTSIGNEIVSGNACAIPKKGTKVCNYCRFADICRAAKKEK